MKRSVIIAVLALISVMTIGFVVAKSLAYFNDQEGDSDDVSQQNTEETNPSTNQMENEPIDPINEEINSKAKAIENEANGLMESNPAEAHNKYLEAEQAYREAGNMNKVGEMLANAQTAQALAAQQTEQPAQ